jgi:uncharacterized DUF497 family protein
MTKKFIWSEEKNQWLKQKRSVSFDDVFESILAGRILAVAGHPNQEKYPGQEILTVEIRDYAYIVPFIVSDKEIFLKTVIPSRKATKQFLSPNQ